MAHDASHHNCAPIRHHAASRSTTRRHGEIGAVSMTQAEPVSAIARVRRASPSKFLGNNASLSSRPSNTKKMVGNNTLTLPTPHLIVAVEMRIVIAATI
jgi:hypothetical protein